jgi:glutaminyl-peptide cyclotransferase
MNTKEPLMSKKAWVGVGCVGCALLLSWVAFAFPKDRPPALKPIKLVAAYDHDPAAFSQGLVIHSGEMFEGTGQYGNSSLRKVDIKSGRVLESVPLSKEYFGEGITLLNGTIYQLTWREKVCFVYDAATLKQIGTFQLTGKGWDAQQEGWGLANDGKYLYMSDGKSNIRVIDPAKFTVVRQIRVHTGPRRVEGLNELEFVNGELLANIWYSDHIARISPESGEVLGWLDASQLYPAAQRPSREHVLNGIAFDQVTGKLYLTGKNWPKLFEVQLPE